MTTCCLVEAALEMLVQYTDISFSNLFLKLEPCLIIPYHALLGTYVCIGHTQGSGSK